MDFNQRISALLDAHVNELTASGLWRECAQIEADNAYIPSGWLWAVEYVRMQVCVLRKDRPAAIVHARRALAQAPYQADLLEKYRELVTAQYHKDNIVLIISCKKYENKAISLYEQYEAAGIDSVIVSGEDTAPINHPRAIQVAVPDCYEALPRKTVAACTWVYETLGSNVGVLKVDDDQTLVDPARAAFVLERLRAMDVYAGVPVSGTTHDRNWHWNKCKDPALNRLSYGKPFVRAWAKGGAYYLGPGPLEKLVLSMIRFPGLYDGEYYEDKLVGDVLMLDKVELETFRAYEDFGLRLSDEHRFNP